MVLNTNSLDDPVLNNYGEQSDTQHRALGFNPRVQLLEMETEKSYCLKLAKVGNISANGYCVNIYDII